MTKDQRLATVRATWSEARRLTIDALERDNDFYYDDSLSQRNFTANEFRRYFGTMGCEWDYESGELYSWKNGAMFTPTEEELQEFAKWCDLS